ncbi:FtsW/RodA/SpoVE family cell cycle protein [bacterium]|nr:FtsW/RodA/SpoVE family cell cycle protein [bacterium]
MSKFFNKLVANASLLIFISTVWLAFWGTLCVASAVGYYPSWRPYEQFLFLILGLLFFRLFALIDHKLFAKLSILLYLFALFILLLTLKFGRLRWLNLGPVSFQPYEFAKIAIIVFLAHIFSKTINARSFWRSVFLPLLVLAPPLGLLIRQPHFGACALLLLTALTMLILRGVKFSHLVFSIAIYLVIFLLFIAIAPYRVERLNAIFVHDPQGKDYQQTQSIYAIGSGGPFGKGPGNSILKRGFLPEAHTDFLFSVAAEEWGFFFSLCFILLPLGILILTGYTVCFLAPLPFSALLAGGLTSLFAIQSIINLSMVSTTIVPVTGLPLPFFAYGGSSLLSSCISAGILFNIAKSLKMDKSFERRNINWFNY